MAEKKIKKEKIDNVGIHSFSKKADIFFSIISGLIALSCILPFVFVIVISVTDEKSILQNGYSFFPSQFGLDGFEFLAQFKDKILQALFISVFVTVVGTITNVFITTTYAYAISRTTFKYRRFFTIFALLSMLFNAGLVPGYIVVTRLLQLGDTVWALIVPMLLSPFNIILMRSFFKKTIPEAILESARIDGASEARIFFQICLPLSLPGIATITLLTALGFWNDGSTPFFISRVTTCIHCNICSCKSNKIWTTSQKQSASLVNWELLFRKKQVVWPWLWSQPFQSRFYIHSSNATL